MKWQEKSLSFEGNCVLVIIIRVFQYNPETEGQSLQWKGPKSLKKVKT
jgi:hypothetical protein